MDGASVYAVFTIVKGRREFQYLTSDLDAARHRHHRPGCYWAVIADDHVLIGPDGDIAAEIETQYVNYRVVNENGQPVLAHVSGLASY